ncbi:MAG: hypothetical protein ACK4SZ_11280 [Allosphingosinicella sp.]|uniref:hypothetical protein n=1 Tax=Allosphingosinicella sp. TaxID=2823234 RepID=UPI00394DC21D
MLALALAIAALQPTVPPALEVERDPITDRVSALAVIRAPEGRLAIGCDPEEYGGLRLTVHSTRGWFARAEFVSRARQFTFRFDRARPVRVSWETSRRTAWVGSPRTASRMIARARTAQRLAIRARDFEGRQMDFLFDMTGARPLIDEAIGICTGAFVPTALQRR